MGVDFDTEELNGVEYYENNNDSGSVIDTQDSTREIYISEFEVKPPPKSVADIILERQLGNEKYGGGNIILPCMNYCSSFGAILILYLLDE